MNSGGVKVVALAGGDGGCVVCGELVKVVEGRKSVVTGCLSLAGTKSGRGEAARGRN